MAKRRTRYKDGELFVCEATTLNIENITTAMHVDAPKKDDKISKHYVEGFADAIKYIWSHSEMFLEGELLLNEEEGNNNG